jgi:hypothetical protein
MGPTVHSAQSSVRDGPTEESPPSTRMRLPSASMTMAITLDTYSHVLPTLQEEAARDLNAWLSGCADRNGRQMDDKG